MSGPQRIDGGWLFLVSAWHVGSAYCLEDTTHSDLRDMLEMIHVQKNLWIVQHPGFQLATRGKQLERV